MKKILLFSLLCICSFGFSQSKGKVIGKVTDKEMNGEALPFANVFIKGTAIGGTTDMDGNYTIAVSEGKHILVFSFVGYETVEKPITIVSGKTITVNQRLGTHQGVALDEIKIKATNNREKESALLLEQKKAVSIQTKIGAQELARKGVSNAQAALTKVAGVSKQEETGSVFVRGLGDRYNVTSLNGLPLPSNDPSKKNIDLSIFNTDIVESIGVSKTFEVQNYADFGGANVNIKSKSISGKPYLKLKAKLLGANSNAVSRKHFYLQDGPNAFGFKTIEKPKNPFNPKNYSTSWDRVAQQNPFDVGFGILGGKKFNIGENGTLKTFFTASFNAKNSFREGIIKGGVQTDGVADTDFAFESYRRNTNTTLMGDVSYSFNRKNTITFNTLYINSSRQEYAEYQGLQDEFVNGGGAYEEFFGLTKRGTFQRTRLFVNQLLGKNKLSEKYSLNWGLGYSIVNDNIPDRMQMTVNPAADGSKLVTIYSRSGVNSHRFWQTLKEKEFSAKTSLDFSFDKNKDEEYKGKLTLGYSGRFKKADFEGVLYMFEVVPDRDNFNINDFYTNIDKHLSIDKFNSNSFKIKEAQDDKYNGDQYINSGYLKASYKITPKLTTVLGVRGEMLYQKVFFTPISNPKGVEKKYTKFQILPSISAKYTLKENQNLKFAFSKSYTLPQFKEKVNMPYEEVTQTYYGNPDLYASTNYNADLGWEFFPTKEELISLTAFGKIIQNPINEIFINSSSGEISYVNSGKKATLYGVELGVKKNIFKTDKDTKLSSGLNVAYMKTNQDFDKEKVSNENEISADFTFDEGSLTGASDLLINADMSFSKRFSEDVDILATVSYAYFSDKIRAIGTRDRGHLIDLGNQQLDFITRIGLTKNLKIGIALKNILNPLYERIQEGKKTTLVNTYKKGANYELTLSYKF